MVDVDPNSDLVFVLKGKSYSVKAKHEYITGHLDIPEKYKNRPVTSIENGGFKDCMKLKSVKIPKSVKTIGDEGIHLLHRIDFCGSSVFC